MKRTFFLFCAILICGLRLPAQTNGTARLALLAESDEASTVLDVLTAQLSGNQKFQLLERNEIEKVYREQGLSLGNKDYLKLGQILGADGLLLLDVVRTPQATNLMARLIAVKPGVILTDGSFAWPLNDPSQWAESIATVLSRFSPKLTLLAKDAIPISIVNLRSAVSSAEGAEAERQLKLLTIQRLSQQPEFFVLERQKMQLLAEEKGLKLDDSAFWNGSYLLEGVVDQNGYAKDTLTINARLTPPKGGAPLQFEVGGNRTNLAEVINRLAAKVNGLLKVGSTVPAWNAADEAAQYFDEAKWAMRWGIYPEAQAAADSAWALGKRDMDCALVRVRAYLEEAPIGLGKFQVGGMGFAPGTEGFEKSEMTDVSNKYVAVVFDNKGKQPDLSYEIAYIGLDKAPDPQTIDRAAHILELYYEFSRTLPPDEPKVFSGWYNLGIDVLAASSHVLEQFHFVPDLQKPVADKLADLRSLTRSVADWIGKSPSVYKVLWLGHEPQYSDSWTHTETPTETNTTHKIDSTLDGEPFPKDLQAAWSSWQGSIDANAQNIYGCKASWGCLWQEKPEDCIAMYRDLMNGPLFVNIQDSPFSRFSHYSLFSRGSQALQLASWNGEDLRRAPILWRDFAQELAASTNVEFQMLGKAFQFRDANGRENAAAGWAAQEPDRQKMAADRQKMEEDNKNQQAFEKQKQYLRDNKPYNFFEFGELFPSGFKGHSKAQALEIKPLITAYKSNLLAQVQVASRMQIGDLQGIIQQVEVFLENDVNNILNPPPPQPAKIKTVQNTPPAPAPVVPKASEISTEVFTNILLANDCLKIPLDRIPAIAGDYQDVALGQIETADVLFDGPFAHRWSEGKLLQVFLWHIVHLGIGYSGTHQAIAIFNPDNGSWQVIKCPDGYVSLELFQGSLYLGVQNTIQKYNFQTQQWEVLNIPAKAGSALFAIGKSLFVASDESIYEITDGGKGTHILASTRRRPVVSALDSMDSLGSPILFAESDQSLGANIGNKTYRWDGNDWHEIMAKNPVGTFEVFKDAATFQDIPHPPYNEPSTLWIWDKNQTEPRLALRDEAKPHPGAVFSSRPVYAWMGKTNSLPPSPLWKSIKGDYLASCATTFFKSNLYLFVEHSVATNVSGRWTVAAQNGCHAKLVCLDPDLPDPIVVPLKFDLERGQPPLQRLGGKIAPDASARFPWNTPLAWLHFERDSLFIGQPDLPGIWKLPITEIEAAFAQQKQIQLAQKARQDAQAKAAAEQSQLAEAQARKELLARQAQSQKELLAKYDRNHNGVIDPDEKEAVIDDPQYLECALPFIVNNTNGLLDADALRFFDANNNGMLDSREQNAIDTTVFLLAKRLVAKLNPSADSRINRNDLPSDLLVVHWPPRIDDDNWPKPVARPDINDVETMIHLYVYSGLHYGSFDVALATTPGKRGNPKGFFKMRVEQHWGEQHRRLDQP